METCKSFQAAGSEVWERIVRVQNIWSRICMQLDFIRDIEGTFSVEYRTVQEATLEILAGKLKSAWRKLDSVVDTREGRNSQSNPLEVKRWKYVCTKASLDECIGELHEWQTIFDPSWYLTMRIAGQHSQIVDQRLECHTTAAIVKSAASVRDAIGPRRFTGNRIHLPPGDLDYTHAEQVLYSSVRFLPKPKSTKWVLTDPIPYNHTDRDILTRNVRSLATKLANVDPDVFNILKCCGFVESSGGTDGPEALNLVFYTPTDSAQRPRSLRWHLKERTLHNLTDRVAFARQVATAISFVHTLGFVHKNVRPENLLEFGSTESKLGSLYLIGFEQVRVADGRTYRQGDSDRLKDLYRHPDRQGEVPSEDYCMQHDIYGLGVCLLEIGLWDSFLEYDADGEHPNPASALRIDAEVFQEQPLGAMKDHLVCLAETRLPFSMGTVYKDVVVNCLTCLDESNVDFGDRTEFEDEDGVLVGVRYIQKVSQPIASCPGS